MMTLKVSIAALLITVLSTLPLLTETRGLWKSCSDSQCYLQTGDLLIGREQQLTSDSTCGLEGEQRFCVVTDLSELHDIAGSQKCFNCDSREDYTKQRLSHKIENIILQPKKERDSDRWWQSVNGVQKVSIHLDLETEFHFTHLIIRFKTFRPKAMIIERSPDFGKTWKIYRYFAQDCEDDFPYVRQGQPRSFDEIVCDQRYSRALPSHNGEVVFKALPPHLSVANPWDPAVQDLLKITDLRVNFTKLHTFGDDLLDSRTQVRDKYYYAIYSMNVRGSCSCYGHANSCVAPETGTQRPGKVHGRCACTHHTTGNNCEKCASFYNDAPWQPAYGQKSNPCRKCQCNNHATTCTFDPAIWAASNGTSGGVCDGCDADTAGTHCEKCKEGTYLNGPITSQYPCKICPCNPDGQQEACEMSGPNAGTCKCKKNVDETYAVGDDKLWCTRCRSGFFNLTQSNEEGCTLCDCHQPGVARGSVCDPMNGHCTCKRGVHEEKGGRCDVCASDHFGSQEMGDYEEGGCRPCNCDVGGAKMSSCNDANGQCYCISNVVGQKCNETVPGFYIPRVEANVFEAEDTLDTSTGGSKVLLEYTSLRIDQITGRGQVTVKDGTKFRLTISPKSDNVYENLAVPMKLIYSLYLRYNPGSDDVSRNIQVDYSLRRNSNCPTCYETNHTIDMGYTVLEPDPTSYTADASNVNGQTLNPNAKMQSARITDALKLDPGQKYDVELTFLLRSGAERITVDSFLLVPTVIPVLALKIPTMEDKLGQYERDCSKYVKLFQPADKIPEDCRRSLFSISANLYKEALSCDCDANLTINGITNECYYYGGQCPCKTNVIGRRCNECAPNTYLAADGKSCVECECSVAGSLNKQCDTTTGWCKCKKPVVVGSKCDRCSEGHHLHPDCVKCECNGFAKHCEDHFDVRGQPLSSSCVDCRGNTTGDHCERCIDGFYGKPEEARILRDNDWNEIEMLRDTCKPCHCPSPQNQHATTCEPKRDSDGRETFVCACAEGYAGDRCEKCAVNYFGNALDPQIGCTKCNANSNIDPLVNSCDPHNGTIFRCLHNTEGEHCEHCAAGWWGDATDDTLAPEDKCRQCECWMLGTNDTQADCTAVGQPGWFNCKCDRKSGQCPCLPNISARQCQECIPEHYGLALGQGCMACDCDPVGSTNAECFHWTGQCDCKPGFSGLHCDRCPEDQFVDPHPIDGSSSGTCTPCECDDRGTERNSVCDPKTGQCVCEPLVTGQRCNQCSYGTTGELPYCEACGKCFDNWDAIVRQLQERIENTRRRALEAMSSFTSLTGSQKTELEEIQRQLQQMKDALSKRDTQKVAELNSMIDVFEWIFNNDLTVIPEINDEEMVNGQFGFVCDTREREEGRWNETNYRMCRAKQLADRYLEEMIEYEKWIKFNYTGRLDSTVMDVEKLMTEAQSLRTSGAEGAYMTVVEKHAASLVISEDITGAEHRQIEDKMRMLEDHERKLAAEVADLETRVSFNETLTSFDLRYTQLEMFLRQLNEDLCGGGDNSICTTTTTAGQADTLATLTRSLHDEMTARLKSINEIMSSCSALLLAVTDTKTQSTVLLAAVTELNKTSADLEKGLTSTLNQVTKMLTEMEARQSLMQIDDILYEIMNININTNETDLKQLQIKIQKAAEAQSGAAAVLEESADYLEAAQQLVVQAERALASVVSLDLTAAEVGELEMQLKTLSKEAVAKLDDVNALAEAVKLNVTKTEELVATLKKESSEVKKRTDELSGLVRDMELKFKSQQTQVDSATTGTAKVKGLLMADTAGVDEVDRLIVELMTLLPAITDTSDTGSSTTTAGIANDIKELAEDISREKINVQREKRKVAEEKVRIREEMDRVKQLNNDLLQVEADIRTAINWHDTC